MHLYLGEGPRTLYLVSGARDDNAGGPQRALVFRAGEDPAQAIVEFLPKDQVELSNTVRLTRRNAYGCLGLVSIASGALSPTTLCAKRSCDADPPGQIYSLFSLLQLST
jgi:hypothetical protein